MYRPKVVNTIPLFAAFLNNATIPQLKVQGSFYTQFSDVINVCNEVTEQILHVYINLVRQTIQTRQFTCRETHQRLS